MTNMEKQLSEKHYEKVNRRGYTCKRSICCESEEGKRLHWSAQAAVTEFRRLGDFNSRNSFSHSSGGWMTKIREPAQSSSGEVQLPGLQMATFLLYSPIAQGQKESKLSSISCYKGTNPIVRAPALMTSPKPNYPPNTPTFKYHHTEDQDFNI